MQAISQIDSSTSYRRLRGAVQRIVAQCTAAVLLAGSAAAQTGTVMPQPKYTAFDNSGNPISGGKLCVYQAGTSTPTTTYSDAALSTPNTNPVIADSAGRMTVFLAAGSSYKFVLRQPGSDATCATGTTLWTQDNVLATPATTSNLDVLGTAGETVTAGQLLYLSDGSGSKTPGQWYLASTAAAYSSTTPILGMAPTAIASGAAGTVRIGGTMTGLSVTAGSTYYVSSTPGSLSTSGAGSRRVGVADTTTSLVFAANPPLATVTDVTGTAGEALAAGSVVYLSDGSGSKTAGSWFLATNANTYSSLTPLIGVVPSAISSSASGTIRLGGSVSGLSALTAGTSYYIGTAGALTSTVPTTGNVRRVGVADTTTSLVVQGNPAPAPLNAWTTITTTSTGTQNDFAPGLIGNAVLRCNNASTLTITGLTGGYDGQRVLIVSIGAGEVDLSHQAAGSSAASRFVNFVTSGITPLAPSSGSAELVYDGTTARWRMVAHEQGAWIQPTTPTFGGNGAQTWTGVTATGPAAYMLRGRTLTWFFDYSGTVGGTPNTQLTITSPNGYTFARTSYDVYNELTDARAALVQSNGTATTIALYTDLNSGTNWTAGTRRTMGTAVFEVQ